MFPEFDFLLNAGAVQMRPVRSDSQRGMPRDGASRRYHAGKRSILCEWVGYFTSNFTPARRSRRFSRQLPKRRVDASLYYCAPVCTSLRKTV